MAALMGEPKSETGKLLAAYTKQLIHGRLLNHKSYIKKYGEDMPEIPRLEMGAGPTPVEFPSADPHGFTPLTLQ